MFPALLNLGVLYSSTLRDTLQQPALLGGPLSWTDCRAVMVGEFALEPARVKGVTF